MRAWGRSQHELVLTVRHGFVQEWGTPKSSALSSYFRLSATQKLQFVLAAQRFQSDLGPLASTGTGQAAQVRVGPEAGRSGLQRVADGFSVPTMSSNGNAMGKLGTFNGENKAQILLIWAFERPRVARVWMSPSKVS